MHYGPTRNLHISNKSLYPIGNQYYGGPYSGQLIWSLAALSNRVGVQLHLLQLSATRIV